MTFLSNRHTKTQLEIVLQKIERAIYQPIADLKITAWRTKEPVPFEQRTSGQKLILGIGDRWGELFDCAWFCFEGKIPESAAGQKVVLLIDLNGEAMVVDSNGDPVQCLTPGSSIFDRTLGQPGKTVVELTDHAKGEETVVLWADVGNNDLFGTLPNEGRIRLAHIAICHEELRRLYYDDEVLLNLLDQLPEDSARYQRILYALYRAAIHLNHFTDDEAKAARAELAPELNKKNGDASLTVSAIGHAHLDLAWLWPIRETIRKGARTFSNALMLMEKYPEFRFGASQAQLYQWMKDRYARLYQRVQQRVADGRWELLGITWVEPDTNLIGGEAMIRQFLYGYQFFRNEFGQEIKVLFLPDSFGYSGALPQIMTQCGVRYFVTIKLSWDRFNTYPHHSFIWQGIDGSEVLVHMPPEGTYNSSASPKAVKLAETRYLDKAVSENCLMIYGIGDGGGGPGVEHLERLARMKNLDGIAPVTQEKVTSFFQRLEQDRDKLPRWFGELYLGMHQGTYTSQARNKRYNRHLELALRSLEFLGVLAGCLAESDYPQKQIETIWKELLLYQFHDILPGSSITRVYDESLKRYGDLTNEIGKLRHQFLMELIKAILHEDYQQPVLIVNPLSWERKDWIKIGPRWFNPTVPAMGYRVIDIAAAPEQFPVTSASSTCLENELLKVNWDAAGNLISIYDKQHQRSVLQPGAIGNELIVYEDDGDAWDFSVDYRYRTAGKFELQSSEARIDGPQAILTQVRRFGDSTLIQNIKLTAGRRRLDFETEIDWHERHRMLRSSFPIHVLARQSVSEIQFGHIQRPTHQNTSWEHAKFEICAHKWIDLSQSDYGVALLNDCKYGHRAFDNVLDINLLRSPTYPDPDADQGIHHFTYSLYPHAGDHVTGGVIRAGYELNIPLEAFEIAGKKAAGSFPSEFAFITVDVPNVIVETVKPAEDQFGFILRIYEAHGITCVAKISTYFPIESANLVDLLERQVAPIEFQGNTFALEFRPFEIKTVRLMLSK